MSEYVSNRRISLKGHSEFSEQWLQNLIAKETAVLGLGDLEVKDLERVQPAGGRLDMLLYDSATNTRFEVELQLGATNESHIIRTIEYWDIERRRFPNYEHVGVIVAEEITARFFNVISLFNGFIPLVAIQVSAIDVDGKMTLVFTRVLDQMTLGTDEEEQEKSEPVDRSYWEFKASAKGLALADRILDLARRIDPHVSLKYNKHYIGFERNGTATNFVGLRPKQHHLNVEFKSPRTDELSERVAEAGIEELAPKRWAPYHLSLTAEDFENHEQLIQEMVHLSHQHYWKTGG